MSEKIFYVYEHWRPDKDVCFYVGKGSGRRANDMGSRNRYHKNIKYKLKNMGMCVEVRLVRSGLTHEESLAYEVERIDFWKVSGVRLANIATGGIGAPGVKRTDAEKARISREKTGNTYRKGSTHSEKTRRLLSIAATARFDTFKTYMHLGPQTSARKVFCVTDGIEHESASSAARFYGVAKSAIIELCLGQRGRKTVGGRVFEYVED